VPKGTVRVSVEVPGPPEVVYRKLTNAREVSFWFGDLSHNLEPGTEARLDFGDGDFFTITNVTLRPESAVEYDWRFLGTGPCNRITCTIERAGVGTTVTVNDAEPLRSKATVDELTEGWTDFLQRLQDHLASGQVTRYDWRRDFEGAVEIQNSSNAAAQRLLHPESDLDWIPFRPAQIIEDARVRVHNDAVEYIITGVERPSPERLNFSLTADVWHWRTRCELAVKRHGQGALLSVHHNGWDEISSDLSVCMASRRTFAEAWIKALDRARLLADG